MKGHGIFTIFCLTFIKALFASEADAIVIPHKRFPIHVRSKLPDRVERLQVWYSLDLGKTWKLYQDIQNPHGMIPIKVSEDGRYSFYITMATKKQALTPPVSGKSSFSTVIVDTKKPELQIQQTKASQQNFRLTWKVADLNLVKKPLRIFKLGKQDQKSELHQRLAPSGNILLPEGDAYLLQAVDQAGNTKDVKIDR